MCTDSSLLFYRWKTRKKIVFLSWFRAKKYVISIYTSATRLDFNLILLSSFFLVAWWWEISLVGFASRLCCFVCFKEFLYAHRSRKDEINRSHYGKEKVFCVSLKLIFFFFLGGFSEIFLMAVWCQLSSNRRRKKTWHPLNRFARIKTDE